jgi:hypothetical protein
MLIHMKRCCSLKMEFSMRIDFLFSQTLCSRPTLRNTGNTHYHSLFNTETPQQERERAKIAYISNVFAFKQIKNLILSISEVILQSISKFLFTTRHRHLVTISMQSLPRIIILKIKIMKSSCSLEFYLCGPASETE